MQKVYLQFFFSYFYEWTCLVAEKQSVNEEVRQISKDKMKERLEKNWKEENKEGKRKERIKK